MGAASTARALGRVLSSSYFSANIAILLTYAAMRAAYVNEPVSSPSFNLRKPLTSMTHTGDFATWEVQIAMATSATGLMRAMRASGSLEGAAFVLLTCAQLHLMIMAFMCNKVLFLHYALAFVAAFLLLDQPTPADDTDVETLDPIQLKEVVMNAEDMSGDCHVLYLHVPWSLACRHSYSTFAELAGRYVTRGVRFESLNLGEWPHVSKRLGVDMSSASMTSLPAVVLYEKGVEVARIESSITRARIVNEFELDRRLAVGASKGEEKKKKK